MEPSDTDRVPVANLFTAGVTPFDQFEAWRQASAPLFDVVLLGDPATFSAGATCHLAGGLVFTRVFFERMHFSRRKRHLSDGESDCISLQYYRTGSIKGCLDDGTPLLMAPDRISLQDFAHAYCGVGETSDNFGVVIPRHRIDHREWINRHRPMFSWSVDSPNGRLLMGTLAGIWRELPNATQNQAAALSSGLVGLINGLLAAEANRTHQARVESATLKAMQDYLCANLHRQGIGVDDLCRSFRCSRATVYRMFKTHGGIQTYLRNQRLEGCFQELSLPGGHRNRRGRVREVAERWGFYEPSHFNRLFRQRFACSPSDALDSPAAGPAKGSAVTVDRRSADVECLRGWLQAADGGIESEPSAFSSNPRA